MDGSSAGILHSLRDDGGVLRLTLSDTGRRNALSEAMLTALGAAIAEAAADDRTRVVVIAAEGPAFCAGHDLKELTAARAAADRGRAHFEHIMALCASVMQSIVGCPKPVIAEVGAIAAAAGCQLVASCDLAVAGQGAGFTTPGVHIGLFCSTPMVALSRNVARKHAMEMLLTGEVVSAARAAEIGLVNRVVADAEVTAATMELAATIASKSTMTVATGKRAFYEQADLPLAQAYDYAARVMVDNMLKRDAEEGIGAFVEKRSPIWTDS